MFTTYLPSKELQPFVAFLYHIKWKKSDYPKDIDEFCLPGGFAFMVFQSIGRCKVNYEEGFMPLPQFYICGQQTIRYNLTTKEPLIDLVGAAFKPTGLWHLFNLDMPALKNYVIETKEILNDTILAFAQKYDVTTNAETRLELIEGLLKKRIRQTCLRLNVIDSSIELMDNSYGCLSIGEIACRLGISVRYFQKKFVQMVGITPSVYNRIIRFNSLFAEINLETPTDYKLLSALFNYYDFPHFSKDFKKYCGSSPSNFHIEKFRFLKDYLIENPLMVNHS